MIGKLYDDFDAQDNVLDEEMIEMGEELDRQQSSLFEFEFQPIGHPKKALKSVHKQRGVAQKKQLRPATKRDDVGREINRGVANMARRVIQKSQTTQLWKGKHLKEEDRVMCNFITIKSSHPLQSSKIHRGGTFKRYSPI